MSQESQELVSETRNIFIDVAPRGDRRVLNVGLHPGVEARLGTPKGDHMHAIGTKALQDAGLEVITSFDGGRGYAKNLENPNGTVDVLPLDVIEHAAKPLWGPMTERHKERKAVELGYYPEPQNFLAFTIRVNPGESDAASEARIAAAYKAMKEGAYAEMVKQGPSAPPPNPDRVDVPTTPAAPAAVNKIGG